MGGKRRVKHLPPHFWTLWPGWGPSCLARTPLSCFYPSSSWTMKDSDTSRVHPSGSSPAWTRGQRNLTSDWFQGNVSQTIYSIWIRTRIWAFKVSFRAGHPGTLIHNTLQCMQPNTFFFNTPSRMLFRSQLKKLYLQIWTGQKYFATKTNFLHALIHECIS